MGFSLPGQVVTAVDQQLQEMIKEQILAEQMAAQEQERAFRRQLDTDRERRMAASEADDQSFRRRQETRQDAGDLAEALTPGEITGDQAAILRGSPATGARVTSRQTLGARPVVPEAGGVGPQSEISVLEPTMQQALEQGQRSARTRVGRALRGATTEQERRGAAAEGLEAGVNVPGSLLEPTTAEVERLRAQDRARERDEWKFRADYDENQIRTRPHRDPVPIVINTSEGPKILNRESGTTRPITTEAGTDVQPAPTADMRNKIEARRLVKGSIDSIEQLSRRVITQRGIAQRATAAGRSVESVLGQDPEFRVYQDARKALAGNLAVAQQGSRPSDADIMAIWLPLVPDVFRDTDESTDMKWNLIRQMSHVGGASEASSEPQAPSGGGGTEVNYVRDPKTGKLVRQ